MAAGMGDDSIGHWFLAEFKAKANMRPKKTSKPPFAVPTMAEIRAMKPCGLSVVSTFSGCGGSSLGYKMAGFRVLWANEFIPAAQDTYRANFPDTPLDLRDIRQVQPEEILKATGLNRGELDLLDGSPPCASFSTAGKRSKGWGDVRKYSDTKQRVDDLFFEYARLLEGLQPKTFVAENVSGLVKGVAKGYFKEILQRLKSCGYLVECQVLDAQWLGVPQTRQRCIFVGVRKDLAAKFSVAPAHPSPLPHRYSVREACPWIRRAEEDTRGDFSMGEIAGRTSPTVRQGGTGHLYVTEEDQGTDIGLKGCLAKEYATLKPGQISKKYFNLVRTDAEKPSPGLSAVGGRGGGSATTALAHPFQRRKFTIAELKRICAFPDDFMLTGTYAQQWERLGRAVPPVMMFHVARTVRDEILSRCR
jgi:DNA (cytosine-5)-methyltransferase 1